MAYQDITGVYYFDIVYMEIASIFSVQCYVIIFGILRLHNRRTSPVIFGRAICSYITFVRVRAVTISDIYCRIHTEQFHGHA